MLFNSAVYLVQTNLRVENGQRYMIICVNFVNLANHPLLVLAKVLKFCPYWYTMWAMTPSLQVTG